MERQIEASTRLRAPIGAALAMLRSDPGCLVTDGARPDERRLRRFSTAVSAPVVAGAVVQQDVSIELGTVQDSGETVTVPLSWRPTTHERVLPTFLGALLLRTDAQGNTQLVLRGTYDVPLGPVGRFGDSLVGRRVARSSVSELLERMAERLDRAVDHGMETTGVRPAPYPVDLRERPGPENHLG